MKFIKICLIPLIIISEISSYSLPIFASSIENDPLEITATNQVSNNNDLYLESEIQNILVDKIQSDDSVEDNIQILHKISGETKTNLIALTYVVQDEQLVEETSEHCGLHALTTASAIAEVANTTSNYDYYKLGSYDTNTYTVYAYSTIYFNTKTISGLKYYQFVKFDGGYTTNRANVTVSGQSVQYGIAGTSVTETYIKSNTVYPSSTPWSYYTGYTSYVNLTSFGYMGTTYTLTIKSRSSTWTHTHQTQL